jgi:periplasmic protein TonB
VQVEKHMRTINWQLIYRTVGLVLLAGLLTGARAQEKRVARTVALKSVVNKVEPVYPPVARQMKMEGSVEIDAFIGEDGSVERVQPVVGNPVLSKAAEQAVRQWKFTPFKDEGKAFKAVVNLQFAFKI